MTEHAHAHEHKHASNDAVTDTNAHAASATHSTSGTSTHRPLSVSARLGALQFHLSGKFRVLQFADIQDGPTVSADTIRLIEATLDRAKPDVVIFTGNQIAGYDPAFESTYRKRMWSQSKAMRLPKSSMAATRAQLKYAADLQRTRQLVHDHIEQVITPLNKRGIPWAVTYGNHDFQCGLSNAELDRMYRSFEGCLNPDPALVTNVVAAEGHGRADTVTRNVPSSVLPNMRTWACEPGTFALQVKDENQANVVFDIVLVDSGSYAPAGGYGSPSPRALEFLRELPERERHSTTTSLSSRGFGAIVFQHTATPQFYQLLQPVPHTFAHAVEGYRTFAGQYYALNPNRVDDGAYIGEGISCPDEDSGEFSIMREAGGYFALVCGHDHRNAFCGTVDGITLIETPTCGFGSYGPVPARRAARLFEFDIRHPFNPRTQLLEFGALVGKPDSKKAYVYGMTSESKPHTEGMNLLHKPNAVLKFVSRMLRG